MSNKSMMVVADLFQLPKVDGNKFEDDTSYAKKKRSAMVVERAYAERINQQWAISGKKYVFDEEATINFYKIMGDDSKKRSAQDAFEKMNNVTSVAEILKLATQGNQEPVQSPIPTQEVPSDKWELDAVKEHAEGLGIEVHHLEKKETLLEKIKAKLNIK